MTESSKEEMIKNLISSKGGGCIDMVWGPHQPYTNTVNKPWGYYIEHFRAEDKSVCFKTLVVYPTHELSMQYHEKREELWYIPDENAKYFLVNCSIEEYRYNQGWPGLDTPRKHGELTVGKSAAHIKKLCVHSIKNIGDTDLVIHEMQYGKCDEDDIVRLHDPYKR